MGTCNNIEGGWCDDPKCIEKCKMSSVLTEDEMQTWMRRAAAILPLIPRDQGTAVADEVAWLLRTEKRGDYDEPTLKPLAVGDPVTYAPSFASQLPPDGWTIDRLPTVPIYIIKHPGGASIAVAASEITRSVVNRPPEPKP